MAASLLLFFTFTLKFLAVHSTNSIALKLTKDLPTLQYTTHLLIGTGTPQLPVKLVVDLSSSSLWLHCPSPSTSRNLIRPRSLSCSTANAKSGGQSQTPPTTTCDVRQHNPITGTATMGVVAEDVVSVDSIIDRLLFSCVPDFLLKGLASEAKGMLGFGKSAIGFPSQLVNNFDVSRKFTLCLPSSDGFIVAGDSTSTGISKSLKYTPLVRNSDKYQINVNSVKINGKRVVLGVGKPAGGVEISTIVPYTTMKSSVYEMFREAFVQAASSMNMSLVSPVAPFGVCFGSQGVEGPEIELVLQSEMVKWKIRGMVEGSEGVRCLGVVDGGSEMASWAVIGGYQLEEHLLEFNLESSMLGFSSFLLMEGSSCSSFRRMVSRSRDSV